MTQTTSPVLAEQQMQTQSQFARKLAGWSTEINASLVDVVVPAGHVLRPIPASEIERNFNGEVDHSAGMLKIDFKPLQSSPGHWIVGPDLGIMAKAMLAHPVQDIHCPEAPDHTYTFNKGIRDWTAVLYVEQGTNVEKSPNGQWVLRANSSRRDLVASEDRHLHADTLPQLLELVIEAFNRTVAKALPQAVPDEIALEDDVITEEPTGSLSPRC